MSVQCYGIVIVSALCCCCLLCAAWICCFYHYHCRFHRLHAFFYYYYFSRSCFLLLLHFLLLLLCFCFFIRGQRTTSCALIFANTVQLSYCIHNNGKCILNTNFLCAYIILFFCLCSIVLLNPFCALFGYVLSLFFTIIFFLSFVSIHRCLFVCFFFFSLNYYLQFSFGLVLFRELFRCCPYIQLTTV